MRVFTIKQKRVLLATQNKNSVKSVSIMNERSKNMMYWCLFITIFGIQVCNAYSSNIIKDYHNKDYLVSSSSAVNRFEDNEIRGLWNFHFSSFVQQSVNIRKTQMNNLASLLGAALDSSASREKCFTVWLRARPKRWNLTPRCIWNHLEFKLSYIHHYKQQANKKRPASKQQRKKNWKCI